MPTPKQPMIEAVTREAMELLGNGRMVSPFSSRQPGFGLAEAYAVTELIRSERGQSRGETAIGRKIGFTNTTIWETYGISGPIWGYVYDTTVHDLASHGATTCALAGLPEPRIEPELALHLAQAPREGMSETELAACIDWVAPAFEVVFSIFPGWKFAAADAVAAYGVHAGLYLGPRVAAPEDAAQWAETLASFGVELSSAAGVSRPGHARNVLGSPVRSLSFLLREIARTSGVQPVRAGEIVTTGTLTEAMPLAPGDAWTARYDHLDSRGECAITLRFA